MKNLLPLFFSLFIISTSFAQTENIERQRKNTIFLEAYKPVFTNSIKYYDTNEFVFGDFENYSKDINVYAIGVGFERVFKNDIVLRPRLGLSVIDVVHNTKSDFNNNPNEISSTESGFVYEQSYINLFLGLSKRIQLSSDFNIDFGLDLAVISYLEGTSEYYTNNIFRVPDFSNRNQEWHIVNYGKAMSYGIGPILKPEYKLKMGLSISFEIQYYFMKTISNSEIKNEYRQKAIFSQIGFESVTESENFYENDIDFSEWSWSEFSPLIRLGYSF